MFKNPQQRKFLFALDKDKQKQGLGQPLPNKMPMTPMNPPMGQNPINPMTAPPRILAQSTPKMIPPTNPMNPTAIPALPGLNKLPKFGKMKNSLKGQFKGIK